MLRLVSQVHGKNEERPSKMTVRPTSSVCLERLPVEFFEQTGITKMNNIDFSASCTELASFLSCLCSTHIIFWQAADNSPAVWLGPQIIVDTAQ
jgi:hypothetical protein